jgi:hypothetical protein
MADTRTLTDRTRSAEIRDWARDNGWEVSGKGAIPKGVMAAFDAAHGGPPPADDGPDWDAALAGEVADPLAAAEAELDAAAEGSRAGEVAPPPPPADLAEARARMGGGKARAPGWARDDAKTTRRTRGQPDIKVTAQVRGDIEGKLTLLLSAPAVFWSMADPICGGAFSDNLERVVKAAVPLIVQSPDAVRWFTKGATFILWLDLVWALQPVAQAVYAHHVQASVMVHPVTGEVVPSRRLDDGRVVPVAGGERAPDMSAYTTEVAGHVPPVPA